MIRTLAIGLTVMALVNPGKYIDIFQVDHIENEVVTFISDDGNMFEWETEEGEDWAENDIALSIMHNNGTTRRDDDAILGLIEIK